MARGKSNHTMFNKIMGNLGKNAVKRGHNIIFFPYYFNYYTKRAQKSNWGKIYDIFSPCVFIFSPFNCSFTDNVLGGKYGKREIKSYNVS